MAKTINTFAASGESGLIMYLYTLDSDVVVASSAATEASNRQTLYQGSFTNLAAGTYLVQVEDPALEVLSSLHVIVGADENGTYTAYESPPTNVDEISADIWTSVIEESYANPTDQFTPAQALYEICQTLSEFQIQGTNLTVRARDRESVAMRYELNSATQATARTRVE